MTGFFEDLYGALSAIETTSRNGFVTDPVRVGYTMAQAVHQRGGDLYFIGNGGSAAIASHMANDWTKNGGMRARCFNDPAALTCIGNDDGYASTFSFPASRFMRPNDMLFAVSSSGRSNNILAASEVATANSAQLITLSGFDQDNPLRKLGDLNIYVPSSDYGVVECAHLSIIHAMLNEAMRK